MQRYLVAELSELEFKWARIAELEARIEERDTRIAKLEAALKQSKEPVTSDPQKRERGRPRKRKTILDLFKEDNPPPKQPVGRKCRVDPVIAELVLNRVAAHMMKCEASGKMPTIPKATHRVFDDLWKQTEVVSGDTEEFIGIKRDIRGRLMGDHKSEVFDKYEIREAKKKMSSVIQERVKPYKAHK